MIAQEAAAPRSARKKRPQWPRVKEVWHKNGTRAWMVDSRKGGRGERLFFRTRAEADTKADQLRVTKQNEGSAGLAIPEKLRTEAMECARLLNPLKVSLREAVDYYVAHARPSGGIKPLKDITAEFLKAKKEGNRRPEYLRVQRHILDKFGESFGERPSNAIHADEISTWLHSQPWSLRTRRNYHNDLSNFFGFAVRKGYCAENPLDRLEKPTLDEPGAPEIFTVAEAEALLGASERLGGKMTAFFALGLFAGLRTAELLKIDWCNIDLEAKTVEVPASVSKTRDSRYITMPENLVAWLAAQKSETGLVRPAAWRYHRDLAREAADLTKWPDNGMRHSFGSYHFAKHSNATLTAAEMGHRGQTRTLFSHYRALVKPKDAASYWRIMPGNVSPSEESGAAQHQ